MVLQVFAPRRLKNRVATCDYLPSALARWLLLSRRVAPFVLEAKQCCVRSSRPAIGGRANKNVKTDVTSPRERDICCVNICVGVALCY